jgi:hypothetical protein
MFRQIFAPMCAILLFSAYAAPVRADVEDETALSDANPIWSCVSATENGGDYGAEIWRDPRGDGSFMIRVLARSEQGLQVVASIERARYDGRPEDEQVIYSGSNGEAQAVLTLDRSLRLLKDIPSVLNFKKSARGDTDPFEVEAEMVCNRALKRKP